MTLNRAWLLLAACLMTPITTASANVVTDWDEKAVAFIQPRMVPPVAYRAMAILHIAMFDALNSIEPRYRPYYAQFPATQDTSKDAAATAAAGDGKSQPALPGAPCRAHAYRAGPPRHAAAEPGRSVAAARRDFEASHHGSGKDALYDRPCSGAGGLRLPGGAHQSLESAVDLARSWGAGGGFASARRTTRPVDDRPLQCHRQRAAASLFARGRRRTFAHRSGSGQQRQPACPSERDSHRFGLRRWFLDAFDCR